MEWISVKDRLPENNDSYLLWDGTQYWFGHLEEAGVPKFVYYFGHGNRSDREFTHWMPLPPPPTDKE